MRKRLIPVLLVDRKRRLVKTEQFGRRTYIGDPFNVIRLFNEKEVDEICVLDIDATPDGRSPDMGFLSELARECFMPVAYGGGVRRMDDVLHLGRIGIEKIVLGAVARDLAFVNQASREIGSQAVVACVDVKGDGRQAVCHSQTASVDASSPLEWCKRLEDNGVGEIILQSVSRDGMRTGYDLALIQSIAPQLRVPLIALGGAGQYAHLADALAAGASASASGSTFTFIGRLRAVLVNYPDESGLETDQ